MGTDNRELFFQFNKGLETYSPEVSSEEMRLALIENFYTRFNRLNINKSHSQYEFLGERIVSFGSVYDFSLQILNFFVFTETSVYVLELDASQSIIAIGDEPEEITIDKVEIQSAVSNPNNDPAIPSIDDDFRVKLNGNVVSNPKRNVIGYAQQDSINPWSITADQDVWTVQGPLKAGDRIDVDVFDGWQVEYQLTEWYARVYYSTGAEKTFGPFGKTTPKFQSSEEIPDWNDLGITATEYFNSGPHGEVYYDNGAFSIRIPPDVKYAKPTLKKVGDFSNQNDEPIVSVGWDDNFQAPLYFTKLGTPIHKVTETTLTQVDLDPDNDPNAANTQNLSGRYMAVVQNHLAIAYVQQGSDIFPRRVRWSDLFSPEDFEIARDKEGDQFDLEIGDFEITGLFSHKGFLVLMTRSSIWRARYIGFPKIYEFEKVFNGLGNIYHYAAIQVRGSIFFIGEDNFYVMDNFNPKPIGGPVWKFWEETADVTIDDFVRGYENSEWEEVFWVYTRKSRNDVPSDDFRAVPHKWIIAYNYREDRWSTRDALDLSAFFSNIYSPEIDLVIDRFSSSWDQKEDFTSTVAIDDYPWAEIQYSDLTRSSDTVTATSSSPHTLSTGDKVTIEGSTPSSFDVDNVQVTVVDSTTFTYSDSGPDETASTPGKSPARTIDGNWQFFNFPFVRLVGDNDSLRIFEDGDFRRPDNTQMENIIETHEMFFDSVNLTKEVEELKLVWRQVGAPEIKLQVGYRNNLWQEKSWTNEIDNTETVKEEKYFIIRQWGKFLTFRFIFRPQTSSDFVDEVIGGSLLLSQSQGSKNG